MARDRRGYTVTEMIIVMVMLAAVLALAMPRAVKSSPRMQVDMAARALARDLEQVRMRAIAAKRTVRVSFYEADRFYTAFMDTTAARLGSAAIVEDAESVHQSRILARGSNGGVPGVELPRRVEYGVGTAASTPVEGVGVADFITLENDRVEFDPWGLVTPAGSGGVILLTHKDDPAAVAAVTISGMGAFKAWRYREGTWIE